jgi:hypothetical protein
MRRILAGLVAGSLILVTASGALAATFGSPGVLTEADAPFVQVIGGQQYQWFVSAQRDEVAGVTTIYASYSTSRPIRCGHGISGAIDTSWSNDGASGTFVVGPKLGSAIAAARVTGTESTFNECTGTETDKIRSFTVGFVLLGSRPVTTSIDQQDCVDFGPPVGVLDVTQTTTFRDALGTGFVNGRAFGSSGGDIFHQVTTGVADAACPPSQS